MDAYRSTRVKDTERPEVKQVIVRKEDVSQRAKEATASAVHSIKQKMKVGSCLFVSRVTSRTEQNLWSKQSLS